MKYEFVKIKENDFVNMVTKDQRHNVFNPLKEYTEVFEGKGDLGTTYKIEVDETVTPIINAPRRVPFSLQ